MDTEPNVRGACGKRLSIRDYCLELQRHLAAEEPRHTIAWKLNAIIWPAMRQVGDAPVKPPCLNEAAGNNGLVASLRGEEDWVEQCVDQAIHTALEWCARPERFDVGRAEIASLLVVHAIRSARSAWNGAHSIIASLVNEILHEKNVEPFIMADSPPVGASLLDCRVQLAGAIQKVPISVSMLPTSDLHDWQPWSMGFANGAANPPVKVGRLYVRARDDDLIPALNLLRGRPRDWPWLENTIVPIEHDAVDWARCFDEMEGRIDAFRASIPDAEIAQMEAPFKHSTVTDAPIADEPISDRAQLALVAMLESRRLILTVSNRPQTSQSRRSARAQTRTR